jgi:hypothetical protein
MTQTTEERNAKARARAKAWYQQPGNAEVARARSKAWYEANKDRAFAHARNWRERNPHARRAAWIKSKYHLTAEQYEHILRHSGECDACGATDRSTEIDHDHDTGAYRGQLCGPCNKAAGHLQDDADRALALHRYLKEREHAHR